MLQLSHLKLIAGVVFALFILTACGGGGGGAAAPATGGGDDSANTDSGGDGGNAGGGDSGGGSDTRNCTDAQFDNGTACVTKITSCTTDATKPYLDVANNQCVAYTQATCESADKFWRVSSSACETNYEAKKLAYFDTSSGTDEYSESLILEPVNAAQAYVNIEALIDADNNSGAITQGGAGQIVSIVSERFRTSHQEFGTNGAAFESVYDATKGKLYTDTTATTATYTSGTDITDTAKGNCTAACTGSQYAALIAGRKGGTSSAGDMHGIAYNAKLRAIIGTSAHLANIIPAGVDADIVAMNHIWTDVSSVGAGAIDATELTAWKAAVTGTNKTIMVFSAGNDGYNSENGSQGVANGNHPKWRAIYPTLEADLDVGRWLVVTGLNNADGKINSVANGCGVAIKFCLASFVTAGTLSAAGFSNNGYQDASYMENASSTVAGSLAVLKGAFPNASPEQLTRLVLETSDYIELDNMEPCGATEVSANCTLADTDDFKPLANEETNGRRLVCKDTNGVVKIAAAGAACSTVGSGFTQKTAPDDTTLLYVNPVYGYGRLNLDTATKPGALSYVSTSNNESIGVLWKDTQLTLSSHFGTGLDSVKLGIGDEYGRHFTVKANKITSAPVAVASLDEYMANILADNVQSQTLGGQAKLNYSNNAQPWMNLEYVSGKATSKIAFQDNYKISPLNDNAATSILRANHIRPASNNIGMMDVDYALNGALSLSSYAARGEYDTGYKFDELGTDFDVNYKKSHLNIAIGNIREHDQFLGTHTTGGYALNAPTVSRFTDVTYGHDVGNRFNIYANYINYETDVDMLHDQFASIDGLQADQYQIGFTGKSLLSDDDNLNVALITKLGVTDGALNQNTTLGYTADGGFNDVSQSYDLAVNERHQQFEITYQGKIYQNSQDGVSVLKDNRFFTTIRVDQNLNHVQGASQTEIVSGINARF